MERCRDILTVLPLFATDKSNKSNFARRMYFARSFLRGDAPLYPPHYPRMTNSF